VGAPASPKQAAKRLRDWYSRCNLKTLGAEVELILILSTAECLKFDRASKANEG
jgi:hypothetical protein